MDKIIFKKCTGAPKQGIKGHPAPLSAFGKHSRTKDGLQPNCKECKRYENAYHNPKNNPLKFGPNADPRRKAQHALLAINYKLDKEQRTPPWSTKEHKEEILQLYTKCKILSKESGIAYEVDHIIPLRGKIVSGLHIPWNLQISTREENNSKRNKWNWERQE